MPPENPQKTLEKPSGGPENIEKPSKNPPADPETHEKPSKNPPRTLFLGFFEGFFGNRDIPDSRGIPHRNNNFKNDI